MINMKLTISFCLYGMDSKYLRGARENVRLVEKFYPGAEARFYVSEDVRKHATEISPIWFAETRFGNPKFARLLVADDDSVDVFLIRDCDSRIGEREVAAVNEWLASGKAVHVMRDHPHHSANAIMGGMWGAHRGALLKALGRPMTDLLGEWEADPALRAITSDQEFLKHRVWPRLAESDVMQHDEFSRDLWPGALPFPMEAVDGRFVGEILGPEGERNLEQVQQWEQRSL